MSEMKRVGFFHFRSDEKCDPLGSLEAEIKKQEKPELADALLVLPKPSTCGEGITAIGPNLVISPNSISAPFRGYRPSPQSAGSSSWPALSTGSESNTAPSFMDAEREFQAGWIRTKSNYGIWSRKPPPATPVTKA
jgi:hypothetical protein